MTKTLSPRDLGSVAIMVLSSADEVSLHRNSLRDHNGVIVPATDIAKIKEITQQKIAIIVDQSIGDNALELLIEMSDKFIEENPDMSLRIFYLKWSQNMPSVSGGRLRVIDANKVAAHDLPIHINRSLYKARLPYFLRQGYDIEISHELQTINGENYRPITIKKHLQSEIDSAADYSDAVHHVYVEDNKLQKMYQVTESGRLESCEWDETKTHLPNTVNITGKHGLYSKEHNRFYRINSGYELLEINPKKTRPGKIDYTSVGLMIHNKELFMLDTTGKVIKINEDSLILSQKNDSKTPPGPLPLSTYKSGEDEE